MPVSLVSFIRRSIMMVLASALVTFAVDMTPTLAQSTAIGQVEKLRGSAKAFRTNNKVDKLKVGDPIYSGDTVQSGPRSRLGIVFIDQTVFSLSANATMVINNLVFNPNRKSNRMRVDLVEGAFAFLTGKIASTGKLTVETSVAQIGIRGTQPWIIAGPTTSFGIQSERDGSTGEYVLLRKGTNNVIATVNRATVGTANKFVMTGPRDTPRVINKTRQDARLARRLKRTLNRSLQSADSRAGKAPGRGRGRDRGGRGPTGGRGDSDGGGSGASGGDSDGGHQ